MLIVSAVAFGFGYGVYIYCIQTAWFFCVVNLTNFFMGGLNDAAMFKWSVWTNLIVAVGPIYLWAARKSRHEHRWDWR